MVSWIICYVFELGIFPFDFNCCLSPSLLLNLTIYSVRIIYIYFLKSEIMVLGLYTVFLNIKGFFLKYGCMVYTLIRRFRFC